VVYSPLWGRRYSPGSLPWFRHITVPQPWMWEKGHGAGQRFLFCCPRTTRARSLETAGIILLLYSRKKRPDQCGRSRPVTGAGLDFRAAGVGDACPGPWSGSSLNRESDSSRRAESPFQRKQSMSTISYPHLPAAAHQPDGEHLQFGAQYIHCGEPMHPAASEQGAIYTPLMTEPEQTPTGIDLEVYLQTRVLRCGCGFQMEIPDPPRDRQGQTAVVRPNPGNAPRCAGTGDPTPKRTGRREPEPR
jgi:hypothetical protein